MKKFLLFVCALFLLIALFLSSCKPKQNCPAYPPYSKSTSGSTTIAM